MGRQCGWLSQRIFRSVSDATGEVRGDRKRVSGERERERWPEEERWQRVWLPGYMCSGVLLEQGEWQRRPVERTIVEIGPHGGPIRWVLQRWAL